MFLVSSVNLLDRIETTQSIETRFKKVRIHTQINNFKHTEIQH